MESFALITFLTDFGLDGGYVAACELVILSLYPPVRVVHLTHEVAAGDVRWGAEVLARVAPLGPPAVHLAVVDPGVGTGRRALALHTRRGDFLVGPDNGLLLPAAERLGGALAGWSLDPERVRPQAGLDPESVSLTFHGRDLFAPATALLAGGLLPGVLGEPCSLDSLAKLPPSLQETTDRRIRTEVIEIDRFGNVGLSCRFEVFAQLLGLPQSAFGSILEINVEGETELPWIARVVRTFGELAGGELGVYRDSWGQASLSLNGASAAQLMAAVPGSRVVISLPEAFDSAAAQPRQPSRPSAQR
jgi:S-adenosyl-L-methionine hydrolase (adenosine-forming)